MTLSAASPVTESKWTSGKLVREPTANPVLRLFGPPRDIPASVLSTVQLDIFLAPFGGAEDGLRLTLADRETVYSDRLGKEVEPTAHSIRICTPPSPSRNRVSFDCEAVEIYQSFDPNSKHSAATAYRGLADGARLAAFQLSLKKQFATDSARSKFIAENTDLRPTSVWGVSPAYGKPYGVTFAIPEDLFGELLPEVRTHLQKGTLLVTLDGKNVELAVDTEIASETRTQEEVTFLLRASSPVRVQVPGKRRF